MQITNQQFWYSHPADRVNVVVADTVTLTPDSQLVITSNGSGQSTINLPTAPPFGTRYEIWAVGGLALVTSSLGGFATLDVADGTCTVLVYVTGKYLSVGSTPSTAD